MIATQSIPGTIRDLLVPVSVDRPAGEDITRTEQWLAIQEARRKDKLSGRRNCEWPVIQRLVADALAHTSKDLRLAVWLLEAEINVRGFQGLWDGARFICELIEAYWEKGLYPELEDGDLQAWAMPLSWLGTDSFVDAICAAPITARNDGGPNYSWRDYLQSQAIATEKDVRNSFGDVDPEKESKRKSALEAGGVAPEVFAEAINATGRAGLEDVRANLQNALTGLQHLDRTMSQYLGVEAPVIIPATDVVQNCLRLADESLVARFSDDSAADAGQPERPISVVPSVEPRTSAFTDFHVNGLWREAEELIDNGRLEEGLLRMTTVAGQHYGRVRFQQRLRLAEICLNTGRARLGISILEELARIIDELHLEKWETPELLGGVWGRLYRRYRDAAAGSEEAARASTYFERLCKLDPWQALRWDN